MALRAAQKQMADALAAAAAAEQTASQAQLAAAQARAEAASKPPPGPSPEVAARMAQLEGALRQAANDYQMLLKGVALIPVLALGHPAPMLIR